MAQKRGTAAAFRDVIAKGELARLCTFGQTLLFYTVPSFWNVLLFSRGVQDVFEGAVGGRAGLRLQLFARLPGVGDHGIGRDSTLRLPRIVERAAERLEVVATLADFGCEPLRFGLCAVLLLRDGDQRATPISL